MLVCSFLSMVMLEVLLKHLTSRLGFSLTSDFPELWQSPATHGPFEPVSDRQEQIPWTGERPLKTDPELSACLFHQLGEGCEEQNPGICRLPTATLSKIAAGRNEVTQHSFLSLT